MNVKRKALKPSRVLHGAAVIAAAGTMFLASAAPAVAGSSVHSAARQWNDELLEAIRHDLARPTVHARNLFHISAAMWDAWAAYDDVGDQYLHFEKLTDSDIQAAREEAISFAAYRLIEHRFQNAPGAATIMAAIDARMLAMGYNKDNTNTIGDSPSALGNRIAQTYIVYGLSDNSNEVNNYANQVYEPINEPLVPPLPGNPEITDPNRWQPLALMFFEDQSGNIIPFGYPDALSPEWGIVKHFALQDEDATIYQRDGFDWWVYHDPGPPPYIGGVGDDYYKWGFEMVTTWSSHLDPTDGVMIDISPASFGNSPLPEVTEYEQYYDFLEGGDWSQGHDMNPATGMPYVPQIVPRGDYARILAEFWADGPDSETPPGHWFTIMNYVADHPMFEKRFMGKGPILDDLEWDVKAYLCMGGAMHDVAISAWGTKGWYDYIRPVSAIRFMCDQGQCSDPLADSFHAQGINLIPGYIELVTAETTGLGGRHFHLGANNIGKIAVKAWRGPDYINDPETDDAGVGWILADNWWPYQRPSFVSPPFPGYISGHSTYSRAAAELMTLLTGSEFFPGGMGEFHCPQNDYLVFEEGPSVDVTLQWATYRDASDQTSMSRIWGGIHPPCDDIPGRHMGVIMGPDALEYATTYFEGINCLDTNGDGMTDFVDLNDVLDDWGNTGGPGDINNDGVTDFNDLNDLLDEWGSDCHPG